MGFLSRRKSIEELEEEKEHLSVETEVLTKKAEIAEREAVIKELKSKYGPSWTKTLGVNKFTDLSTLRSFLISAKRGLDKQAGSTTSSTPLSRMTSFKGLHKA